MDENEVTARHAIQASAEQVGGNVINLALFPRAVGYDAVLLCSISSPGHVAKYVTWRSHWLKGQTKLPGVYWGTYHIHRKDADEDYDERHARVAAIGSCFIPQGEKP